MSTKMFNGWMYFACGKDMDLGEPKGGLLWVDLYPPKDILMSKLQYLRYALFRNRVFADLTK